MKVKDMYWRIINRQPIGSFEDYDLDGINRGYGKQKTPIMQLAVQSRNIPLIEFLLKNGADVNGIDRYNNTALHWLGSLSHVERNYQANVQIARLLLEHGADPNLKDKVGNNSIGYVIHYSKKFGNDLIKVFLEYGADPNIKNNYGISTKEITTDKELLKLYEEYGF